MPDSVAIIGASSNVGHYSFEYAAAHPESRFSFLEHHAPLNLASSNCTVSACFDSVVSSSTLLLCFAPIWILVNYLESLPFIPSTLARIVCISSTSAFTKANSDDSWERNYAQRFRAAELSLKHLFNETQVELVILRPTMIWGNMRDKNISSLINIASSLGVIVLPALGTGLRAPIHARQLFDIAIDCLCVNGPGTYNVAGPEELPYHQLCKLSFVWLGLNPCILTLPTALLAISIDILRFLFRKPYLNKSSFLRISQDLVRFEPELPVITAKGSFCPLSGSDLVSTSLIARIINSFFSFTL